MSSMGERRRRKRDACHYWAPPTSAMRPICGRTSGYGSTDARDATCGICWRLIRAGWSRASKERNTP